MKAKHTGWIFKRLQSASLPKIGFFGSSRALFSAILIASAVFVYAQERTESSTLFRLQAGVDYYERGMVEEALVQLRSVEAETLSKAQKAEALFWIGVAELSAGDYETALHSLEALETLDPGNRRIAYVPYYKGRVLYHLGRYDESIVQLAKYRDAPPSGENSITGSQTELLESSALYWIGECLFAMGRLDEAEEIFSFIVDEQPSSFKYEAAYYRVTLIAQKRVESELLGLLGWTHEESLKTIEEYQRREHTYEQELMAYQRRIDDLLKDNELSELLNENTSLKNRVQALENELGRVQAEQILSGEQQEGPRDDRLSTLREMAVRLWNEVREAEGTER